MQESAGLQVAHAARVIVEGSVLYGQAQWVEVVSPAFDTLEGPSFSIGTGLVAHFTNTIIIVALFSTATGSL